MNRTEAIADFDQDLDEISLKTEVEKERLKECPECGESVYNRMALIQIRTACVTYECHGCGTVDDIWAKSVLEDSKEKSPEGGSTGE